MSRLKRILAVLDGTGADAIIVTKSVALARQHRARLELFLCDAQRAYSLQHAYDSTGIEAEKRNCVRDARRYLASVRDTAVGADVAIWVDAVCESPLYEGIVRKVLRSRPDLVIKNAAGEHQGRRFAWDANDWQLMRACPATLLLSRGQSWRACPKFAAAVEVSSYETGELSEEILRMSRLLADGCRGQLEVVTGVAEEALPDFAASRGYDAFVMGALTHRMGVSPLVETLDCDLVLVKPASHQSQVECPRGPLTDGMYGRSTTHGVYCR